MSKMPSRSEPELCEISIGAARAEFSEAMSSIWLRAYKRVKGNRFRGDAGKDIEGMGGDDVREVRDHGNAVPGIGSLVRRCVNGWGRVRKSRGRVRT